MYFTFGDIPESDDFIEIGEQQIWLRVSKGQGGGRGEDEREAGRRCDTTR
jgi:hypothetical protein